MKILLTDWLSRRKLTHAVGKYVCWSIYRRHIHIEGSYLHIYIYKYIYTYLCTYRPGKVEGELYGIREASALQALRIRQIEGVLAQNGRDHITVRALRCGVYGRLVVLQADPKPRLAGANALARRRILFTSAAMALVVPSMLIAEVFQPQFKIAGTVNLRETNRKGERILR